MPVGFHTAPLENQLSTNAPGKAVKDSPGTWAPAMNVGDPDGAPDSWVQHLGHCGYLGSEPVDGRAFSLLSSLSLSLHLSNKISTKYDLLLKLKLS